MVKVVCNLAISLDGYISKLDGSVDFLESSFNEEQLNSFNAFLDSIDSIVMGSTSYDKMIELGGNSFTNKDMYVLTSKERKNTSSVQFLNQNVDTLVKELKSSTDKNIWLFGGSNVIKQFIDLDIVDEYILTIAPFILGSGIQLFDNFKEESELKLIKTEKFGDFATLYYIRKR